MTGEGAPSLARLLAPRSVAVIGASRRPASLGRRILESLLAARYEGTVYPVNPEAASVCAIRAYPAVADLPETPDLAIIVVPKAAVRGVLEGCARKGVPSAVVITAGFAETGEGGMQAEREIADLARAAGIRLVGPNCMGLANADPAVRLNGSFSPILPSPGPVAMASQSGALGMVILAMLEERGLGLSTFVSLGNKADVSGNDLLEYWENDPATGVVLLYLESFGNPRRFVPIARRVGRAKPIIALKSGRTAAGQRAAGSHTAALAASDAVSDALFRQAGIVRADTIEEMFDLAALLGSQPLPAGRRVGIVTNAGGPGILCADACEAAGLSIPEFPDALRRDLRGHLPAAAGIRNPVDMIASAAPADYARTARLILSSRETDALIVIHTPVDPAGSDAVLAALAQGVASARQSGGAGKPVLLCRMTQSGVSRPLSAGKESIPTYAFPENAAQALAKAADYAAWRRAPAGEFPAFPEIDAAGIREICRRHLADRRGGWLSAGEVRDLIAKAGLPAVRTELARTPEEAVAAARAIGFPVAVKLASRTIVHKSEAGGVHLGLADEEGVRSAFAHIREALARRGTPDAMDGVTVQPMSPRGVEVMAGVSSDPLFGPVVAFGLGGIHVEILGDVVFRAAPLARQDAEAMIRGIKGFRLLEGYRGHPPADLAALQDILLRLSWMAGLVPEIAEIDLNPVFALAPGQGCRIPDARIRVAVPRASVPAHG